MILKSVALGLFILAATVCFFGCQKEDSSYQKGYEDGFDQEVKDKILSQSQDYQKGYKEGKQNSELFYMGYRDSQEKRPKRFPNNQDYMSGYDTYNSYLIFYKKD